MKPTRVKISNDKLFYEFMDKALMSEGNTEFVENKHATMINLYLPDKYDNNPALIYKFVR